MSAESPVKAPEIPNYKVTRLLGEGAMARVWLAEHKRNGRKAAIKILKPEALVDADAEELFLREGQVLASFDHPNIVKIYDNDKLGELAYLVMECLPAGTLLDRMQRGPIKVGEALGLVVQIANALEAAHRAQVIHRDLKPANIMLRDETTPVLTDFGAVRVLNKSTIYGRDGGIVGTPIYMSPEQITGQTLGGTSDLYALGVIFHELLTGRLPFPGGGIQEVASQHLFAPVPKLPVVVSMLQPILEQLLAKKPEQRFASAQAFVDALRKIFLDDEALRWQVGYSGTTMAWSSQLRALGFVLDPQQNNEVRRAQGEHLQAEAGKPVNEVLAAAADLLMAGPRSDRMPIPGPRSDRMPIPGPEVDRIDEARPERAASVPTAVTQVQDLPRSERASAPTAVTQIQEAPRTAAPTAITQLQPPAERRPPWLQTPVLAAAGLLLVALLALLFWPKADNGAPVAATTPAAASSAADAPVFDLAAHDAAVAARTQYQQTLAQLAELAQTEKRDLGKLLDENAARAQQAADALAGNRFAEALTGYQTAETSLQQAVTQLLDELEQNYARLAKDALDGGRLREAQRLVERGKALRALRQQARTQRAP